MNLSIETYRKGERERKILVIDLYINANLRIFLHLFLERQNHSFQIISPITFAAKSIV